MICPNCGSQNEDQFRFCMKCGAPMQQHSPAAPVFTPPQVPVQPQPPVQNRKNFPLWIPIVIGVSVLVLAVVIIGAFLLFGKKTVYLITEGITESITSATSIRREYDEKGRLISVETNIEYSKDYYDIEDSIREIQYEYDKDGTLIGAELDVSNSTADYTVEIEYFYEKGVLQDIEADHSNGDIDFDFRFTDDGKIKEITLSESGDESVVYNFRYYDNGRLKSTKIEYPSLDYSNENHYDEQGNLTEFNYFLDGNVQVRNKYEYEGESTFFSRYTTITYQDGKEETRQDIIIDPVKDGDILSELNLTFEVEGDGEKHSVQFTGEIEWDGLEGTWEPKVRGDIEELGDDFLPKELETEIERDAQGHITRFTIFYASNGMRKVVLGMEEEYTAIKVPRNYSKPSTPDPRYSLDWAG